MKFNILTIAAAAALTLVSCSEGKYWSEPEVQSPVYAFAKPAATVSVPATATIPSSYEVTVSRSTAGEAQSIPVEFKSNSSLVTGASTVEFPAGSAETKYVINLAQGMKAGVTYTASVSLPVDTIGMPVTMDAKNLSFTLNISQVLVLDWQDKGVAQTVSQWAGNESLIDIPVQQAVNYPDENVRLMRLVSPYWYLEPEFADKGYNLQFFLDKDGNAKSMYQNYTFIGEVMDGDYIFFGVSANYGGYFSNEGNIFTMKGVMFYGPSATSVAGAGWYETLMFRWTGYGQ